MNKRIYPYEPDVPGYLESAEFFSWQLECRNRLAELLRGMDFRNMTHKPKITCYRSGETGVVQVWDRNWKLHVQCVLRGDKEEDFYKRNGIDPLDIVVSLDVEADSTDTKYKKQCFVHLGTTDLNRLRKTVLQYVSSIASNELGDMVTVETKPTEHLVWESMVFAPGYREDIDRLTQRMKIYVEKLLPIASEAMDAWAEEHGFHVGG